ncbi:MAG: sigma-70 family RNA polymerase sigma factor [Planctomycetota bacterium]
MHSSSDGASHAGWQYPEPQPEHEKRARGDTLALVRRFQGGDGGAATVLVDRYRVPLRRLMEVRGIGVCRSDCDADDLCQDTLLLAMAGLRKFEPRGPGSFWGWLRKLGENVIADRGRHLKRRGRDQPHLESGLAHNGSVEAADCKTTVRTALSRDEEVRRVTRAWRELPPLEQRILDLRFLHEHKIREIAQEVGLAKSTVLDRMLEALATLAAEMQAPENGREGA